MWTIFEKKPHELLLAEGELIHDCTIRGKALPDIIGSLPAGASLLLKYQDKLLRQITCPASANDPVLLDIVKKHGNDNLSATLYRACPITCTVLLKTSHAKGDIFADVVAVFKIRYPVTFCGSGFRDCVSAAAETKKILDPVFLRVSQNIDYDSFMADRRKYDSMLITELQAACGKMFRFFSSDIVGHISFPQLEEYDRQKILFDLARRAAKHRDELIQELGSGVSGPLVAEEPPTPVEEAASVWQLEMFGASATPLGKADLPGAVLRIGRCAGRGNHDKCVKGYPPECCVDNNVILWDNADDNANSGKEGGVAIARHAAIIKFLDDDFRLDEIVGTSRQGIRMPAILVNSKPASAENTLKAENVLEFTARIYKSSKWTLKIIIRDRRFEGLELQYLSGVAGFSPDLKGNVVHRYLVRRKTNETQ